MTEKIPEHRILENPSIQTNSRGVVSVTSHQFGFSFDYDDFPNDFIYEFSTEYQGSPLLQMSVIRPNIIKNPIITNILLLIVTERMMRNGSTGNA